MKKSNNYKNTLIVTIIASLIVITTAFLVQSYGQKKVIEPCSYLDPIIIDILAFIAGLFLIIEGFYKLYKYKESSLKLQLTRIIRVAFGCAIVTLHIMQFLHK
jgi:hypothetical protein